MKIPRLAWFSPLLLLCAPLVAPALPGSNRARVELAFQPNSDWKLTKSWVDEDLFELDGVTMSFNGEEHEAGDAEMSFSSSSTTRFTDSYDEIADGHIARLTRSFEDLERAGTQTATSPMDGEERTVEITGRSELDGHTVIFAWDEEAGEYRAEFDGEGDEDLLADLAMDSDLAGFLPEGSVAEGESWDVDLAALLSVLHPSGDLRVIDSADGEEEPESEQELERERSRQLDENLEGTLTATLSGVREEDGSRLAVIALEGEVQSTSSVEREGREGGMPPGTATRAIDVKLTGELLWLVDDHRASSLALEFELEVEDGNEMSFTGVGEDGEELDIELVQVMHLSGTSKLDVTFEPAE
jgi:hypothetical protein